MRWIALAFALLWPALALAFGPQGQEDRCVALGSVCKCSEPLNTNSYTNLGSAPPGNWWNPNDTTGGGTACASVAGVMYDTGPSPVPVANLGPGEGHGDNLPAGASLGWVLSLNQNIGQLVFSGGESVGSNARWCARSYMMYDEDTVWNDGYGTKYRNMHMGDAQTLIGVPGGGGDTDVMDHGWAYFDTHMPYVSGTAGCNTANPVECVGSGVVTADDMVGHWFRNEHCIYISGGNWWTEGYMQSVTGPAKLKTWSPKQVGPATSSICGAFGCEGFRNVGQDQAANYHLINSMTMWAVWTTPSPGTFIGPAVEFEGTGAPAVACSVSPTTITSGAGFAMTITPSGFTEAATETSTYQFDMTDDGTPDTCTSQSGTLTSGDGTCDTPNEVCTCTVSSSSIAVGPQILPCEIDGPTEDANSTTTLTVQAATWTVTSTTATPNSCTQGNAACDNVDLSGSATGTATGAITWSYKCRVGDSFTALGGTCTGTSCTATDVCDYIADAAGSYAPSLQSTRQSITDDTPGTFTITAGGTPSTPQLQGGTLTGGRISWLGDMIRRGGWRSLL